MLKRAFVTVLVLAGFAAGPAGLAEEKKPEPKLLTSFESDADMKLVAAGHAKMERVQEHASDGKWSLKVFFPGAEKDTWPGITFVPPVPDISAYDVLAFDVFNPAEKPMEFAVRVDDASKQGQFIMLKLKAGATTTVDIWIKGLRPKLDPTKITQIYPYRSKPREDCTLYLDNFRLGFATDRFKEIVFAEDRTMPPVSEQDRQRGCVLFRRHYMDYVMPNTVPKPEELDPRLDLFAAQGEIEPAAFAVRALDNLKKARVTVSDLTDPAGHHLQADAVDIRVVRYLKKRLYYPSFEYMLTPTYLESVASTDIPGGTTQCYWLTLHVSEEAAPGVYSGEVVFAPEGRPESRLPLRVRVLPFALKDAPGLAFAPYYSPWGLNTLKSDDEKKARIRRDLEDMRAHGMTTVGLCVGFDQDKITVKDGKVDLGLNGTSVFEWVMDAYRDLHFPEPILVLSDTAQTYAAAQHPLQSEEFARDYKLVQAAIAAEARKRGWPEIIQQPVDEPAWQSQESMDRNVRCLKVLKQVPGQRTEQDGPGDPYFHEIAGPFADAWNYNGAYAPPDVIRKARDQGHLIWIYNNDVEGFRPEMERYAAGFHLAAAGSHGVYNWEYRGGAGDLYSDFDGSSGDFVMDYLPQEGSSGGPAIGWEGFREGIDDQRYIALLRDTIEECSHSPKFGAHESAKRARDLLNEILASLDYKPGLRGTSKWDDSSFDKSGRKLVHGQYKAPNGWDMATYDVNRWRIAEAVMEMKCKLRELPRDVAWPKAAPSKREPVSLVSFEVGDLPARRAARPSPGGPAARPALTVAQTSEAILIDGKLDDAVWQRPPDIPSFVRMTGDGSPSQKTQVWVTFDSVNLYVAARCQEKLIGKLVTNVREDLGNVWADDCVEVFIDAAHDRKGFFQVAVNSAGYKYLSLIAERAKASKVKTAASVGADAWCCEMAIPLAELGTLGTDVGFNVCRERRAGGDAELSCWSPTIEGFARPERFGDLSLGGKYLTNVRMDNVLAGMNEAAVTVRNDGKGQDTFVVEGLWTETPPDQKPADVKEELKGLNALFSKRERSESGLVTLNPGQTEQVRLPFRIPHGNQRGVLEVSVRALPARNALASRRTVVHLPPTIEIKPRPPILFGSDRRLGVELNLNVAPESLKESTLEVGVDGLFRQVLKRVVSPEGQRMKMVLDVGGLGPGRHTLYAQLEGGGLRKIGVTARAGFEKIRGPMD